MHIMGIGLLVNTRNSLCQLFQGSHQLSSLFITQKNSRQLKSERKKAQITKAKAAIACLTVRLTEKGNRFARAAWNGVKCRVVKCWAPNEW